jgi:hypothetical protein
LKPPNESDRRLIGGELSRHCGQFLHINGLQDKQNCMMSMKDQMSLICLSEPCTRATQQVLRWSCMHMHALVRQRHHELILINLLDALLGFNMLAYVSIMRRHVLYTEEMLFRSSDHQAVPMSALDLMRYAASI